MKKTKCAVMMLVAGMMALVPIGEAWADVTCPAGSQRATAPKYTQCNVPNDSTSANLMGANGAVSQVINILIGITGVIAVIMIIIGGIHFATSQGDPGKVAKGRKTIIYGLVGLAIAVLAFAIVNYVLGEL